MLGLGLGLGLGCVGYSKVIPLCSLDNLLQKNVIVFFFENQISKWRSFEKRAIFDLLFTYF